MTPEALARLCPDLAGQAITPLGAGSDCSAFAVGLEVIKLPRDAQALAREARVLAVVRPFVRLPLPDLRFHAGPPPFSRHRLLPGVQLLAPIYDALGTPDRETLARDLARFHADCHAVPHGLLRQAGAGPVAPWPAPRPEMLKPVPKDLRPQAEALLTLWQALPPDPLGEVWGHFDAHGWNMAFDPKARRLGGIYDFGDSGFGPLHRDLAYSALISPDLTRRLGRAYADLTGRAIDLDRLDILAGAHRLWELAASPDPFQVQAFTRWAATKT
ncbi:phosphotransferase family protein [Stagnihabitans tardus]|uniref:Phosphotransferase n=1 Tax=Stagnihabitans tardus TaxID=2699202 RepID=A0AAE5BSX0_9RHOB|nr:aminoglycoside phosphotransferase family protein [Stagnihabitans tardus]NBZ88370.1 phosphotransferase [Stagnihabitans tardus]